MVVILGEGEFPKLVLHFQTFAVGNNHKVDGYSGNIKHFKNENFGTHFGA